MECARWHARPPSRSAAGHAGVAAVALHVALREAVRADGLEAAGPGAGGRRLRGRRHGLRALERGVPVDRQDVAGAQHVGQQPPPQTSLKVTPSALEQLSWGHLLASSLPSNCAAQASGRVIDSTGQAPTKVEPAGCSYSLRQGTPGSSSEHGVGVQASAARTPPRLAAAGVASRAARTRA
eukprot:CAMPEP_0175737550 /NCGR_PEP_ID=MMETSP0097-20121207/54015_1 /TAXON_ID=311494 /ORGANISM="Alexandrium monilatum, Strain CCMP3105" /LENGTH=180 /DNA_ID=CAMNT_0017045723 /DNA_START=22 /DNA_END=561 /DNA_ORIENTATION=+